jgi:hypothetical protein
MNPHFNKLSAKLLAPTHRESLADFDETLPRINKIADALKLSALFRGLCRSAAAFTLALAPQAMTWF